MRMYLSDQVIRSFRWRSGIKPRGTEKPKWLARRDQKSNTVGNEQRAPSSGEFRKDRAAKAAPALVSLPEQARHFPGHGVDSRH